MMGHARTAELMKHANIGPDWGGGGSGKVDISDWLQKNYPKVWDRWSAVTSFDGDVEDWLAEDDELFELYLEYLEDGNDSQGN